MAILRGYHGTTVQFDEFKPKYSKKNQLGFGVHFALTEDFARRYADNPQTVTRKGKFPRVIEAELTYTNPLNADQMVEEGSPEFTLAKKLAGKKFHSWANLRNGKQTAYLQQAIDATHPKRAADLIQRHGYDAVMYKAEIRQFALVGGRLGFQRIAEAPSVVVFQPGQINKLRDNHLIAVKAARTRKAHGK